jgi:ADP-ribosylglycohydrolase
MSLSLPESLSGSLLGLSLGDALGAVVEANPPEIAREYAAGLLAGRVSERGPTGFPFGQVTDDSQLARELLLGFAMSGAFDPGDFGARLVDLVDRGRLVGAGPGSLRSAARLKAGVPWREAGEPEPYSGNGAAMRAGPCGVLLRRDQTQLRQSVLNQAKVTHLGAGAAAGALAIATAAALASRQESINPTDFLSQVADSIASVDGSVSGAIQALTDIATQEPPDAVASFQRLGLEPDARDQWRGISGRVVGSVCWSLYAFLRSPDDYWQAVCTAIWAGGDTDTTAAMTGGLVGGRVGADPLPAHLLTLINDRGEWRYTDLATLAERCSERASSSGLG